VAVAGADGLSVWAATTGTKAAWADGPREAFAVAFDPAGTTVAAAELGAVRVRDAQTGVVRQTFESGPLRVAAVGFSPDGSRLATGGADGTVRVWDVASGHELLTLLAGGEAVTGVAWVGDRVFATAGGTVHAWGWGAD
jgi:WD40 repeat protein